ncbi:MAG: alpha/beta hydrolase-fold protein [Tidjanibacter sp.]|nr:alpha/beta hydrolase-fold protein [Tidjanibacter sp.]
MRKTDYMTNLLIVAACLFSAALGSCGDKNGGSTTPPTNIVRYTTDLVMHSDIISTDLKYSVYLPADYTVDTSKRYSVVYLLHGLGDNHQSWNDKWLHITTLIDALESAGTIEPMIYVMPQGFRSYYVNRSNGSYNYMDMFVDEFVPMIDRTLRTVADRDHRAVAGYSMGGFGAMILPSKHPETFSVSIPLSMSFRTDEQYMTESQEGWNMQWGWIFGGEGASGNGRLTDYYKEHCPFYFFNTATASDFATLNYFLDCGDDEEQLSVANDRLHCLMRDLGIAHEYRVRNGAHTSDYWRSAMNEALPYIDCLFKGGSYPKEQSVTTNSEFTGRIESTFAGVGVSVYRSKGYNASGEISRLYLLHPSDMQVAQINEVVNLLNTSASSKNFEIVAAASADVVDFDRFVAAVEEGSGTKSRLAIGIGSSEALYDYSLSGALKALYLFDASFGRAEPAVSTYYYIDLTDDGTNYRAANRLYEACRRVGAQHDYRVRNGLDDNGSLMVGISEAKYSIINNL